MHSRSKLLVYGLQRVDSTPCMGAAHRVRPRLKEATLSHPTKATERAKAPNLPHTRQEEPLDAERVMTRWKRSSNLQGRSQQSLAETRKLP